MDSIRPVVAGDLPPLLDMTRQTAMFRPQEIAALEEVLTDYFTKPRGDDYRCACYETDGQIRGFVCYAPNTMTDRTWDLYWIVVKRAEQARGLGSRLLRFVEDDVRRQRGRLLLIETSSLPAYEPTRRFYRKHGYEQVALVADFYADGDSMIVFGKRLDDPS